MSQESNLKSKKALVTGASRGIGAAIAKELVDQGYQVVGTATSQAGADNITSALSSKACYGTVLVLGEENTEQSVQALVKEHGPFDVFVHNAGMNADNLLLRLKSSDWHKVMDVSLTSFYYLAKACSRFMIKNKSGRIIAITSVIARLGNPGQTHYAAAKAGLEGMTRSLAWEVSTRGVTVNAVAPGFIDTDMTKALPQDQRDLMLSRTPVGRFGTTTDVAKAVSFLVSDSAEFITGATIPVNGGLLMN